MNCTKTIPLTGYLVRYVDLREPKPRTVKEEVYTVDKDSLDALDLLGLNVADFITTRYERSGYHVVSVERIQRKRVAVLDLRRFWDREEAATTGKEVDQ